MLSDFFHGIALMCVALFASDFASLLWLLGLWYGRRFFRCRPSLFYLLGIIAFFGGWRFVFAMKMGTAERYLQLPWLLLFVLFGTGAIGLQVKLQQLIHVFSTKNTKCISIIIILSTAALLGIGKALNPPKIANHVFHIAKIINQMPVERGIIIENSKDSSRLKSQISSNWDIISLDGDISDTNFWLDFYKKISMAQQQYTMITLVLRLPANADENFFENEFRKKWNFFPFEYLGACVNRRFRYVVYRFNFNIVYAGRRNVDAIHKNPFSLQVPRQIKVINDQVFFLSFPELPNGLFLEAGSPKGGWLATDGWRFIPKPGDLPLTVVVTLRNALGWPVGRTETELIPGNQGDSSFSLEVTMSEDLPASFINAMPSPLPLPLPTVFHSPDSLKWFLGNLTARIPDSARWTPAEVHCAEASTKTENIKLAAELPNGLVHRYSFDLKKTSFSSSQKTQRVLWCGNADFISPQMRDFIQKCMSSRGVEIQFISFQKEVWYTGGERPSWYSVANHNYPFGFHDLSEQKFPWQVDTVLLALGREEILWSDNVGMPAGQTVSSSVHKTLQQIRQKWPDSRIIIVLPPIPSANQDSYFGLDTYPDISHSAQSKLFNHNQLVRDILNGAGKEDVIWIPLYLFWDPDSDWKSVNDPVLGRVRPSLSFSTDGMEKIAKLICDELNGD